MNDWDKDNLRFLMSLKTQEDWADWARYCTDDDFAYALELLKIAHAEIDVRNMELDEAEDTEVEFAEARAVLSKFML